MKIKMRVHFAGPSLTAAPGDEIERPDLEALRLIKKGYAVALSPLPEVETAVPKPVVETRVSESRPEPSPPGNKALFGGKGDHDGDGKPGGAKKPARKAPRKRR